MTPALPAGTVPWPGWPPPPSAPDGARSSSATRTSTSCATTAPTARTCPNSCEVTVQVVAPSVEALDDGEFHVFLSPSPGSHRAGVHLRPVRRPASRLADGVRRTAR
nr:lantibiotic dehydratase [Streptomyces lydicus]